METIVRLAVNDGWLCVADGQQYGGSNGRLMRIDIDQTSSEFLKTQQQLSLRVDARMGYGDMAVSFGRYLAITTLRRPLTVSEAVNNPEPGNVYVIDLAQVSSTGVVGFNAVTIDVTNFPVPSAGRSPQYITAGENPGQF